MTELWIRCIARLWNHLPCRSQNHLIANVGRDLWRPSGPTSVQAGTPKAGCPGPCLDSFWRSLRTSAPFQLFPAWWSPTTWVVPPQLQDFALCVKLHKIPVSPSLQSVEVIEWNGLGRKGP